MYSLFTSSGPGESKSSSMYVRHKQNFETKVYFFRHEIYFRALKQIVKNNKMNETKVAVALFRASRGGLLHSP